MIEVTHLIKRYGDITAVNDLSFTIEKGHIYGFLGPNGAGKSTTMNMLTGCLTPTSGRILIDGRDIAVDPIAAKRKIGYLPENPPLYPDMTPFEYLSFVAEAKGVAGEKIGRAVKEVMEQTDLIPVAERLIKNLSKGYRQRVGIAQAMLGDPDIIILDEPTVGLDPKQIIEIRDLIVRLGESKTVILSSHILSEISAVCDHILMLSRGRLVADDRLDHIETTLNPVNTLLLTVRGSEEEVVSLVSTLPGIDSCLVEPTADSTTVSLKLESAADVDVRDELFFALAEKKLPILALETGNLTLEDIFLKLTTDTYAVEDSPEIAPASESEPTPPKPRRGRGRDEEEYTPLFTSQNKEEND